jgi:hypothetical protein
MASIGIGATSLMKTICVALYGLAVAFQGLYLIIEAAIQRRIPKNFSFSYLCENVGVLCVVIGYPYGNPSLICVGALLVALRLVCSFQSSPERHLTIKVSLLVSALLTLGFVQIVEHIWSSGVVTSLG